MLRAVAGAPGDVGAVFQEIALHAALLCGAEIGAVFHAEGDAFRLYRNGPDSEPSSVLRPIGGGTLVGDILLHRQVIWIDDQSNYDDPSYQQSIDAARATGTRSAAYVPLTSGGIALGVAAFKQRVEPFTDAEIDLLQVFAAHAADAIRSAQVVGELNESLALQTATSEVLRLSAA